ncbi:MAG: DJ-1/PfpI family protein [Clostridiales Family XIII bacterium]|jgi:4-methyl-5(b-hydroxyethyl)-thiazole monophosphate biosynthesis|nr:DJ-1/PfpI family protein [Clostridiales Family XIII bacterium]
MIYVHLADGFEEIEALTVVDILRRAGLKTETVSVMGRLPVTGAHGVQVIADIVFEDAVYADCELIVLPGGMPGATNLDEHARLREKIQSFARQDKKLAAICAAPLVLGHAGVLEGKEATCYPGFEKELTGAVLTDTAVCVSGNITTSRGPATAAPFALELVRQLKSDDASDTVASDMLF